MKIFQDESLTEELGKIIDLGIVDAGDVKTFEFWLLNDTLDELRRLTYELRKIDRKTNEVTKEISEEAKVISAPEIMLSQASDSIVIEYAPQISIEKGLRVQLHFDGKRIVD